jgi:hypothetical protein
MISVADLICRSLLCIGVAAVTFGLVAREPAPTGQELERAAFGVLDDSGCLSPSDTVPLVPGQQFGWQLPVDDQGLHTWREVLITPTAPRQWLGADLTIVEDGKVGITERTELATSGSLAHAWTITDGDPAGQHVLELWLDGRFVQRMAFATVLPR